MAKGPERRRPAGTSPILTPHVEKLNMPVNTVIESPVLEPEPAVTAAETSELVEGNPEALDQGLDPDSENTGPVPAEPTESTEAPSLETAPEVAAGTVSNETDPAAPGVQADTETVVPAPAQVPEPVSVQMPTQAPAPEPEIYIPPNMKQPVTINMRTALKLRAETAVLRTAHLPGGYRSQVMLIEAALERELARLEADFNNGDPFPPNVGSFRTGRPLGS